jgi:hypothetical protein
MHAPRGLRTRFARGLVQPVGTLGGHGEVPDERPCDGLPAGD